jgi:hypothetical protein
MLGRVERETGAIWAAGGSGLRLDELDGEAILVFMGTFQAVRSCR